MAATEEPLNRIHVNNLAWSIKEEELQTHFSEFGEIEKVKIPTRPKGGSKGFGFITFKTNEAAKNAVDKMNNVNLMERRIGVVFSTSVEKKKEKPFVGDGEKGNRLVVRQLAWAVTDEQLEEAFGEFGTLTNHKVVKARNGKSKGFGFVVYETPEMAKAAKEAMDGKEIEGRAITVHFSNNTGRKRQAKPKEGDQTEDNDEASPAKGRSKRRRNRRKKKETSGEAAPEGDEPAPARKQRKRRRNKLYVKISTETTEEELTGVFTTYGALKKVDIPTNKEGEVKGHAYVQFENDEDAEQALDSSKATELNGVCLASDWARFKRGGGRRRNQQNTTNDGN